MKDSMLRALFIVLLNAIACTEAHAADTVTRRYPVPDQGALELQVPAEWNEIVRNPFGKGSPTIVFGSLGGTPFEISITPMPRTGAASDKRAARERVEEYRDGIKANAVEQEIELVTFESSSGRGVYFSATDKSPRPGDFRFLTHGVFETGDLAVAFTILTLDGQQQIVRDALAMLKTARHVPKE